MMARLGLGLLIIPQKPWPMIEEDVSRHRAAFLAAHGEEPPACVTSLLVYCDEDSSAIESITGDYVRPQAENVSRHYDFAGPRSQVKGYESYGLVPREEMIDAQVPLQIVGTPEECYGKLADIQQVTGTDHFSGVFSFAGLPPARAERSIRLFAREVMPELRKLGATEVAV